MRSFTSGCRKTCGLFILFFVLMASTGFAQFNNISITLLSQTYNCQTGQLDISFELKNQDGMGNTNGYMTMYSIYFGFNQVLDNSSWTGNEIINWSSWYTPGDIVRISARGSLNNNAPEVEYQFYPNWSVFPVKPSISGPFMPVCSGSTVTLTAHSSNGFYTWSDGTAGESLQVNAPGTYRVQSSNDCGVSEWSDPFVVTMTSAPAAPSISPGNQLLCNGSSTTLSIPGGGNTNWYLDGGLIAVNSGELNVSAAGSYTATLNNACGVSPHSAPVSISTANTAPAPTVSSNAGTLLCNGASATLSATSTGGLIAWNTGDAGGPITVSAPGTYYAVELNACGMSAPSNMIEIASGSSPAAPGISASGATEICSGGSVTLSASGSNITWNTGQTGNSITVSSPGTYYAYASNSCGNSSNSNTITVSAAGVPAAPSISSSNGTQLCNGASTTLTASGSNITWNTGQTGNSITVSGAGSYYAYAANGCGNSANSNVITIAANGTPAAPTVSNGGASQLCNGASTTLTASGSNITWNTGQTGNSITVSGAGSYYAYASNVCGNSGNSNVITISTNGTPGAPSVSNSGASELCNGASTTLTASGSNIIWNTGQTGNSITVSGAGSYYAYAANGCGNSGNSNVVTIATNSTPAAPFVSNSGAYELCNGATTTLTASGSNITWNTGQTGNSITVSSPGTYYAYASGSCGNSANSNIITITTGSTPAAPLVTGGGLLCNGSSTTLSASGENITWNTGQTGNSITVSVAGSYYAYASNGCGNSPNSNTAVITTGSTPAVPSVNNNGSALLCNGSSTTLSASGAGITWNTGATGNTITVSDAGSYFAYASNACGNSGNSSAVVITTESSPAAPVVTNSGSALLCNGASTTLTGSGSNLTWNNGSSGNSIAVQTAGDYYAYATNACGNSANSNVVAITTLNSPAAPLVTPANNQLLCNGAGTTLSASGSLITWSNGFTGNSLTTAAAGTYYAYDRNACGNSVNSNNVVITTGSCPMPSPGSTFYVCPGAQKTLDAGAGFESYLWSNGATTRTISVGPGTYSVTVMKEGCYATSAEVTVNYYTVVKPVISANGALAFCNGASVTLTSSAASAYQWTNGAVSQSVNITSAGTYAVTITDANGCQSVSDPVTVTVNPLPLASIAGSTSVCRNATEPSLTFTGSGGTAPYTFYYRMNGGDMQSITTVSGNSVSVNVPTNVAGTFVYTLLSVSESSGTNCSNAVTGSATVSVRELPTAAMTGSVSVCQNAAMPLVGFTAANGSPTYTWHFTLNGQVRTVAKTNGNQVFLQQATNTPGTYEYVLSKIVEGSGCASDVSETVTIVVNPLPSATIAGTTTVCQNAGQPFVTFSGSGATAPYTFYYNINGGAEQSIVSVSAGIVELPVPTNASGVFAYNLLRVKDASGTACEASATGTATITVNPLPQATLGGSVTVCQNSTAPVLTFTGLNATAPYTFYYRVYGGSEQSIATQSGSSVTLSVPTTASGTFTYELLRVSESSNVHCVASSSGSATIIVNPLPQASVSGSAIVCQNSNKPVITFRGSGATAPYTFRYRINGGGLQSVSSITGIDTVNIEAPTDIHGSFTYELVSVNESSNTACSNAASGSVSIVVNELATAMIAGTTVVCQRSASPVLTLTGSGGVASYTFGYQLNGGSLQTIVSTGSTATITVPTDVPGTFSYQLVRVMESSTTACVNTAAMSATVIVNPQPLRVKLVTPNTHLCNGVSEQLTVFNYVPGNTYTWYHNGSAIRSTLIDTIMNKLAGSFYVQVTSDKGCVADSLSDTLEITTGTIPVPIITGSLRVCPDGKSRLSVVPGNESQQFTGWLWRDIRSERSVSHDSFCYAGKGEYLVETSREGCTLTAEIRVTDDDTAFPKGKLVIHPDRIAYGQQATLLADVSGTSLFKWQLGDGNTVTTTANQLLHHYFLSRDSIPVQVRAISERNCMTDFTAWVSVGGQEKVTIPNLSFSGNVKDWVVFPTPFKDALKVSAILLRNETVRIDMFTAGGAWVKGWTFPGRKGENLFYLSGVGQLPSGVVYFVTGFYNSEKHVQSVYKF